MKAALLALVLAACMDAAPAAPDAAPDAIPVACDGALCKTDNGGSCQAAGANPTALVALALGILLLRRREVRP